MVQIIVSVALDLPSSDPAIDEGLTFTMDGTATTSGTHVQDCDVHWQYDQGTSTWIDIPSSGSELTTANTNPVNNQSNSNFTAITVTGVGAGSYQVRIRTIDNQDGGAEDLSPEQTVTVSVAAVDRHTGRLTNLADYRRQTVRTLA